MLVCPCTVHRSQLPHPRLPEHNRCVHVCLMPVCLPARVHSCVHVCVIAEADEGARTGAGGAAAGLGDDGSRPRVVPAAAAACAGASAPPEPEQSRRRECGGTPANRTRVAPGGLPLDSELKLWRNRSARCRSLLTAWCSLLLFQDFGTAGSPLPLGRLLPKVQEVARCLGELLTAACSGRVSVLEAPGHPLSFFWVLCPEEACLIVRSHRLCPLLLWGPWAPPLPQRQSGSSKPSSC